MRDRIAVAGRLLALLLAASPACSKPAGRTGQPGAGAARPPAASPISTAAQGFVGAGPIDYVFLVSVDGLAPRFIDQLLRAGELATFRQLQRSGAWTHNARSDATYTVTLPNHTTILSGRPVSAVRGLPRTAHHGFTGNVAPGDGDTVHNSGNPALRYVPSLFDVAHDHGKKTCLFAGKDKFVLFDRSYDAAHGAPDRVGPDNGRDKIDVALITGGDTPRLLAAIADEFRRVPCQLTFLHIAETDLVGHARGWGSPAWLDTLREVDRWIGTLIGIADAAPGVRNHWALVLTADHGGMDHDHGNAEDPRDYTIPFYVVGPGVPAGADLYSLTARTRADPGTRQPSYDQAAQPIRNGDAANLALALLGLPDVAGSLMKGTGLAPVSAGKSVGPATD
jgi:predicted AlkP superfamily pyrophosphatase or phosphodiesterase